MDELITLSSKEKKKAYMREYMRNYQKTDKHKAYIRAYNARRKIPAQSEPVTNGLS